MVISMSNDVISIQGVTTGFERRPFWVKLRGRRDARQGQICISENVYTSAWILRKKSLCEEYINSMYLDAAKRMERSHKDVIVILRQLRESELDQPIARLAFNSEQKNRHAVQDERRRESNRVGQVNYRVRMAEVLAEVEQVDAELLHTIERVKAVFRNHVLMYWQGVLWFNNRKRKRIISELPATPELMESHYGQSIYSEKRERLVRMINRVVEEEETA